jgi:hypothetical protein
MEWRRQMLAAGMKGHALEELESHLCEEVESLIGEGRGASEAFETAVHRLGGRELLAAEFAKTTGDGRDRRLKLMVLGLTGIAYLAPLLLSAPKPWNAMSPTEQLLGLSAVTFTVVSMFSGLCLYRLLPVIADKRIRTRIQIVSALPVFAWLGVFAFVVLPRFDSTLSQITVVTLWALSPLSLFGGVILGLDEAAHRKRVAQS